jgi:predicted nucleic acid-binding protein
MIPIQLVEIEITDALKTSHENNIYAYDAYILECAKKLHYPLMTLDEQLITKANQMKIKIIELKKEK